MVSYVAGSIWLNYNAKLSVPRHNLNEAVFVRGREIDPLVAGKIPVVDLSGAFNGTSNQLLERHNGSSTLKEQGRERERRSDA